MVRQVRVIRNTLIVAAIFVLLLWQVRGHVLENIDALLIGILAGGVYALIYWRGLLRRITRKNRRSWIVRTVAWFALVVGVLPLISISFILIPLLISALPSLWPLSTVKQH